MFLPFQMHPRMFAGKIRRRPLLMETASGAFPVPESLSPERFPPEVRESILRLLEGPPKPAVTLRVMNEAQATMIAPDLPFIANG